MRAACIHAHSAGGIFCALAQLHEALHADRQIFAPMADDMQCSAQRLVERQHGHRALVGVPLAEHFWKYRNAQPLRNGLDDGLRTDAFPRGMHRYVMQRKICLQNRAHRAAFLTHQERILRQLLHADGILSG